MRLEARVCDRFVLVSSLCNLRIRPCILDRPRFHPNVVAIYKAIGHDPALRLRVRKRSSIQIICRVVSLRDGRLLRVCVVFLCKIHRNVLLGNRPLRRRTADYHIIIMVCAVGIIIEKIKCHRKIRLPHILAMVFSSRDRNVIQPRFITAESKVGFLNEVVTVIRLGNPCDRYRPVGRVDFPRAIDIVRRTIFRDNRLRAVVVRSIWGVHNKLIIRSEEALHTPILNVAVFWIGISAVLIARAFDVPICVKRRARKIAIRPLHRIERSNRSPWLARSPKKHRTVIFRLH